MLDYYGAIARSVQTIDKEIILYFKNRVNTVHLTEIISELREQKLIENNYSVSGWNVFGKQRVIQTIEDTLDSKLIFNEKKLKLVYSVIKNDLTRYRCDSKDMFLS